MTELTQWEEWRRLFPAFIGPKGPMHCMSFPACCHYEENRQNRIDVGNYTYRLGWLPNGPENWWVPLRRNIEHHHYNAFADATIFIKTNQGTQKVRVE